MLGSASPEAQASILEERARAFSVFLFNVLQSRRSDTLVTPEALVTRGVYEKCVVAERMADCHGMVLKVIAYSVLSTVPGSCIASSLSTAPSQHLRGGGCRPR